MKTKLNIFNNESINCEDVINNFSTTQTELDTDQYNKLNKDVFNEDIFNNLENLRIEIDHSEQTHCKKHIVTVPIRKPNKQEFIRVHPEWSLYAGILEFIENKEIYFVEPKIIPQLINYIKSCYLFFAISAQKTIFIWPVQHPSENSWLKSAMEGAQHATKNWTKIISNKLSSSYDILQPSAKFPDPEWPDISYNEILKIAFKDKIITNIDHQVIQKLEGKIL